MGTLRPFLASTTYRFQEKRQKQWRVKKNGKMCKEWKRKEKEN